MVNEYAVLYKRDEFVGVVTTKYAKSMIGDGSETVYWKKDLTSEQINQVKDIMTIYSDPKGIEKILAENSLNNGVLVVKGDGKTFAIPQTD
jgi:hypothetical protein